MDPLALIKSINLSPKWLLSPSCLHVAGAIFVFVVFMLLSLEEKTFTFQINIIIVLYKRKEKKRLGAGPE